MASEIYNVIDALSREKGIDPQIVVSAVEDAIVAATRKKEKSQENLKGELDKESGMIRVYAVKSILPSEDDIEDPQLEISLDEAKAIDPNAEVGGEVHDVEGPGARTLDPALDRRVEIMGDVADLADRSVRYRHRGFLQRLFADL